MDSERCGHERPYSADRGLGDGFVITGGIGTGAAGRFVVESDDVRQGVGEVRLGAAFQQSDALPRSGGRGSTWI